MPYKNPADKLAWQRRNSGRCEQYKRRWVEKNPERAIEIAREAGRRAYATARAKKIADGWIPWASRRKTEEEKRRTRCTIARRRDARRKSEVFEQLGGICAYCELDDWRVLQIDHIHGDGRSDRGGGRTGGLYAVLRCMRASGWQGVRERFQLLCANCHMLKTHFHGDHLRRLEVETRASGPTQILLSI